MKLVLKPNCSSQRNMPVPMETITLNAISFSFPYFLIPLFIYFIPYPISFPFPLSNPSKSYSIFKIWSAMRHHFLKLCRDRNKWWSKNKRSSIFRGYIKTFQIGSFSLCKLIKISVVRRYLDFSIFIELLLSQ